MGMVAKFGTCHCSIFELLFMINDEKMVTIGLDGFELVQKGVDECITTTDGIYFGLPENDYFNADRINASGLKLMGRSPLHYITDKLTKREDTKAFLIGGALHYAVLEPDLFDSRYITAPDINKRTKAGKEEWESLISSGKAVLSKSDMEMINGIKNSVLRDESAAKLLSVGNPEVTIFTEIEGIKAKARIDWLRRGIAVDLKTVEDASPKAFSRSCAKYGYAIQNAWYRDCCSSMGIDIHNFINIVVEKSPPYAVAIYELDQESVDFGRKQYLNALNEYRWCRKKNEWPGYQSGIKLISLPAWAMKEDY